MSENEETVVLVADDEPSTLALVTAHVRSKGFKVIEASDGDMAWQLAHQHLPDLVILDVMMPGMSGWEVCRKIREALPLAHTGVIMLTGIGENLNEMTSPLYGADAHIDKPFEFSDLDEKINATIAQRKDGAFGRSDGADEETDGDDDRDDDDLNHGDEDEEPMSSGGDDDRDHDDAPPKATKPKATKPASTPKLAKRSVVRETDDPPSVKPAAKKTAAKKAGTKKTSKKAAPKAAPQKAAKKAAKKAVVKKAAKKAVKKTAAKNAAGKKPVKKAAKKTAKKAAKKTVAKAAKKVVKKTAKKANAKKKTQKKKSKRN